MKERKEKGIQEIKAAILKRLDELGIKAEKIILFGSRARGETAPGSDYDFLIITAENHSREEKLKISRAVRKALVEWYIPSDLIIKSAGEAAAAQNRMGSVVREALREGITL